MTNAFVFNDDTILCHQTPNGWWPLQIQLPPFNNENAAGDDYQQAYQLGRVTLIPSLAPSHWQSADHASGSKDIHENTYKSPQENTNKSAESLVYSEIENKHTFTAQAASAITYDYAVAYNIALPIIDESDESSGNAFVPYRQLMTHLPVAYQIRLAKRYSS